MIKSFKEFHKKKLKPIVDEDMNTGEVPTLKDVYKKKNTVMIDRMPSKLGQAKLTVLGKRQSSS
jgi:hypothetical protein